MRPLIFWKVTQLRVIVTDVSTQEVDKNFKSQAVCLTQEEISVVKKNVMSSQGTNDEEDNMLIYFNSKNTGRGPLH